MAKKGRRVRRRVVDRERQDDKASKAGSAPSTASRRGVTTSEEELREQYAYVLRDLRRVFILAAVMFTLLIVLNIVLQ